MFLKFVEQHQTELQHIATAVRTLSMDAVLKAKSGHIGLPLGGAEIGTLLYFAAMKHDSQDPLWMDRDRFVLSAGHGSMLQYSLLHLAGYGVSIDDLRCFRQLGSKTPGHPEYGHTPGVECTTGPLGQGLAMAVGMAMAERMLDARFPDDGAGQPLFDHRTLVLAGDGCLMEGVSAEACSLAGHLKLNRLVVLYDANNITIDGTIDISFTEQVGMRFASYGFQVFHAESHSFLSLAAALDEAYEFASQPNGTAGPSIIICRGIAGKGSRKWEGKPKIHGNPMSADDVAEAKHDLGVQDLPPFTVSQEAQKATKQLLARHKGAAQAWAQRVEHAKTLWKKKDPQREQMWQALFGACTDAPTFNSQDKNLAPGSLSTRVASGQALTRLALTHPRLVGGSADLAGSNQTTIPGSSFLQAQDFSGRNIHFGVREHGMAAICNGLTLHGGFQAYCATFLVFSDYMRPAVRLAALMHIPTLFLFTHDSYAVGEDGPTHQPIEHADALRAIPHLNVCRPADGLETYAAWEDALCNKGPSALLLTRQDVPHLNDKIGFERTYDQVRSQMQAGALVLKPHANRAPSPQRPRTQKITFLASGSEVSLAWDVAQALESAPHTPKNSKNKDLVFFDTQVISCPKPQVLAANKALQDKLLPQDSLICAIEASCGQSWGSLVGRTGVLFHLNQFGASAPYLALAEHLGFTTPQIVQALLAHLDLQ